MSYRNRLSGVVPVVLVPFTDDFAVDYEAFSNVVTGLVGAGVDGLMFPGFASEFHKLRWDERRRLTQTLIEVSGGLRDGVDRFPRIVASVADHATKVAVGEAVWAVEAGADAINLLPPFSFNPSTSAIEAHIRAVVAAVDPTPVILQHAPAQTGAGLLLGSLAAIAVDHPNLRTVKVESQPPGPTISALLECAPAFDSLVGYAGLDMIDAFERGAIGVMPGSSFPELYVAIHDLWKHDDKPGAVELHRRMLPYISAWMQHLELMIAVDKVIAHERGWLRFPGVRQPGWQVDHHERSRIETFLEEFEPWLR